MGSPFQLTFYAPDSATARQWSTAAFRLADSLNGIFSDYLPDSELSRLSATAGTDSFVTVSPLLFDLIVYSHAAWRRSGGVFDITVGRLSRLWRSARRDRQLPHPDSVEKARQASGFDKVVIDRRGRRVKLLAAGMQLDLGGIAKGYSAHLAAALLQALGAERVLVAAAGDIRCGAPPPGRSGWTIGINLPDHPAVLLESTIELAHRSISTSGDLYQYLEWEGLRYSHILDPRTGYGVTRQRNVTVVAPEGRAADWLATAASILPLRKVKKLMRRYGADYLVTWVEEGEVRHAASRGMKRLLKRAGSADLPGL